MKLFYQILIPVSLLIMSFSLSAQDTASFENIILPLDGYQNNAAPDSAFYSGQTALPNVYNAMFQYWEGWAISAITDNVTPGFSNQYSAIPGGGAEGSPQYAVGYVGIQSVIGLTGDARGGSVTGMYLTNNTYTYYSMRDGDAFAKRFGGETGNDPDFFKVTIRKWHNGQEGLDSIEFFLADYRFSSNTMDYIVDQWEWVDLSSLGPVDSLLLTLSSSDNGSFGMNTPAYLCVDQISTMNAPVSVHEEFPVEMIEAFPNPTTGIIAFQPELTPCTIKIWNANGQLVLLKDLPSSSEILDLGGLVQGTYIVQWTDPVHTRIARVIRQD